MHGAATHSQAWPETLARADKGYAKCGVTLEVHCERRVRGPHHDVSLVLTEHICDRSIG